MSNRATSSCFGFSTIECALELAFFLNGLTNDKKFEIACSSGPKAFFLFLISNLLQKNGLCALLGDFNINYHLYPFVG